MKQHNWKNIKELFQKLNEECNYLILRNYEELDENKFLTEEHPDIDLLCDDPYKIKKCLKPVMNLSFIHYKTHCWVEVGTHLVHIDIRFVGDCYYDTKWAQNMLDSRIFHPDGFYIMDTANYFHSLIYHAVFQKKDFAEDYKIRLHDMADLIKIRPSSELEENYKTLLFQFMRERGYFITCPRDITVPMQFDKIPNDMLLGKKTWQRRRLLYFPERVLWYILRRVLKNKWAKKYAI